MVNHDHPESLGEVLEEGTKGDNPKSVMSHEDIPLTNSKFNIISPELEGQLTSQDSARLGDMNPITPGQQQKLSRPYQLES